MPRCNNPAALTAAVVVVITRSLFVSAVRAGVTAWDVSVEIGSTRKFVRDRRSTMFESLMLLDDVKYRDLFG